MILWIVGALNLLTSEWLLRVRVNTQFLLVDRKIGRADCRDLCCEPGVAGATPLRRSRVTRLNPLWQLPQTAGRRSGH